MFLSDFDLKWGHIYDCKDQERRKILRPPPITDDYDPEWLNRVVIPTGKTIHVCATGAKYLPSGVEGSMFLKGVVANSKTTFYAQIFQARLFWDSPHTKAKNRFNATTARASHKKLSLTCTEDFNRKGGALGFVECVLEGSYKEKPPVVKELPPAEE